MKKIILFILFLSLNILFVPPHKEAYSRTLTPREFVSIYSKQFNISENQLLRTAICESKLKPNAINYNDGGKGRHSFGILQFQESTFLTWEKKLGEDLDYYSYQDQIKLGAFMFSKGQQKQWTCFRILFGV